MIMSKIGTKTLYVTLLIATACVFCSCELPVILPAQAAKKPAVIVSPKKASYAEALAGKEIRRYLYLRTDKLPAIIQCEANSLPETDFIAAMQKDGDIVRRLTESDAGLKNRIDSLGPQQYLIKTTGFKNKKVVLIVGGDSAGVLYGTYRFIERFGVRFYLDGDVIPDEKVAFELPQVDEEGKPLFEIRGIHPFHDFPEGPDWWDVDGYKAIIGQLPKLRMNFFGLHTYPEKGLNCQFGNTEPTVWVGITQDTNPDGTVKFATLSRHFTTMSNAWGYKPTKTSRYNFGAAQIFERDDFGADAGIPVGQAAPRRRKGGLRTAPTALSPGASTLSFRTK
jgi:hypothetical protein